MSNGLTKAEKEVLRERLKSEKAVLKALEKQYETALEEIDDKIASLLGRGDADLPHVIHQVQYQRLIKAQVKAALDRLHAGAYETIDKYLRDSYTDGFVGTLYNLHRQDVPVIVPIEQEAAIKAVTIDSKLKEPLYESLGVDVTKLKKTISAEITRGIAAGYSYGEMAQGIALMTKAPLSRARTIVRTEAGRVQEQANFDAANKAKAAGADVVKQWSAVLDGKTRDTHRKLDHQIREMDKPFEIGGKKAMYPHDFGDPAEDCNCRCTLLTRARAALDADELKVMQERAEFFGLDKTDSFEDFKKKYLKAAETVENTGKSGIIIEGENYVSGKGFIIHQDKIQKFLLKPGAKHYEDFYAVGYRNRPGYVAYESKLLAIDIENGYDETKATDRIKVSDGSEKFSIFMNLGFGGGKRFRTVWKKDTPDSKPRLITAHRE